MHTFLNIWGVEAFWQEGYFSLTNMLGAGKNHLLFKLEYIYINEYINDITYE